MRGLRALRLAALLLGTLWLGWIGTAGAAVLPRGAHFDTEGRRYWVSRFALEYAESHPQHPPLASLAAHTYALGQAEDGYVGPRRGGRNYWFRLDEMGGQAPVPVYASGLRELSEQIVADLNTRGLVGVYVAPNPADIDPATGEDRRPEGTSVLRLRVYTGRVQDVRTFAADPVLDNAERVDRPEHRTIAENSPVGPTQHDLIDRKELDAYVARLNRHPGRFVDVVLTPTLEQGRIHVDYLVEEDRPWSLYSSFSNTGPEDTNKWRQRFGFTHTQLTGHDDVLRLDYVTDGFDDIDAFFGSYEGLIPGVVAGSPLEGMRWHLGGAHTEYSSEVGIGVLNGGGSTREIFGGETVLLDFGLVQTIHQNGGLFVDLGAGLRWMDIDMTNLSQFSASMPFAVPSLTLQIEDMEQGRMRYAHFALEKSMPSLAGTSSDDFDDFEAAGGREDLDDDWLALRWDAGWRFLVGRPSRASRAGLGRRSEIELSTEGQHAFGNRLIPQEQGVAGGLYSVRGYPQSVASGDSIYIGHAEYRYHWPLSLVQPAPRWFLDWDLILKGFCDMGYAQNSSGGIDEGGENLASLGVGVELLLRHNLSLRLDHGYALTDVDKTSAGDSETHLSAVVRY